MRCRVSDGAIAFVLIVVFCCAGLGYLEVLSARNSKEFKLTVTQSARCPDRNAKGGELARQAANSPCPSSHFCEDCKRHW